MVIFKIPAKLIKLTKNTESCSHKKGSTLICEMCYTKKFKM